MWEPQPLTTLRASKACRGKTLPFIPGHDLMLDFLQKHHALTAHFPNNRKRSRAVITKETLRKNISFLAKKLEGVNHASIQNSDETNLSDDTSKKKVLVTMRR
jgi:hypothetical protein